MQNNTIMHNNTIIYLLGHSAKQPQLSNLQLFCPDANDTFVCNFLLPDLERNLASNAAQCFSSVLKTTGFQILCYLAMGKNLQNNNHHKESH